MDFLFLKRRSTGVFSARAAPSTLALFPSLFITVRVRPSRAREFSGPRVKPANEPISRGVAWGRAAIDFSELLLNFRTKPFQHPATFKIAVRSLFT